MPTGDCNIDIDVGSRYMSVNSNMEKTLLCTEMYHKA